MATEPQTTGWQERIFGPIGEPMIEVYDIVRGIASTFMLTIYYTLNRKKRREAIAEQLFEIGNKSVMFIAFTLGFLGMILIYQAGYQAMRITGDLQLLGALFLQLLLHVTSHQCFLQK